MSENDKPLVWIQGEVKAPPFSADARIKAGFLLRRLQKGELLELPDPRPMPSIGKNCHELRVNDKNKKMPLSYWRYSRRKHKRRRRKSLIYVKSV
jgi:hypothetical protein